jgi:hypothetical protein
MIDVGARIEVPKHDDLKAWERLYDHVSSYDGDGINELSRNENENYCGCPFERWEGGLCKIRRD